MYKIGDWVQRNRICSSCCEPMKRRISKIHDFTFDADQRSCGCGIRDTDNVASHNQICNDYKPCKSPMKPKYLIGDIVEVFNVGSHWDGTYGPIVKLGVLVDLDPSDTIPKVNYLRDGYRKKGICGFNTNCIKHKDPEPGDWVRIVDNEGLYKLGHRVSRGFSVTKTLEAPRVQWLKDVKGALIPVETWKLIDQETGCPDCKLIGGFCKPCVRAILAAEKPRVLETKVIDICAGVSGQEFYHIKGWDYCPSSNVYVRLDGVNICATGEDKWKWQVYTAEEHPIGDRHKTLEEARKWAEENL